MYERLINLNAIRKGLSADAQLALFKLTRDCPYWKSYKIDDCFDCFWLGSIYQYCYALYDKRKVTFDVADELATKIHDYYMHNYL